MTHAKQENTFKTIKMQRNQLKINAVFSSSAQLY